MSMQYVKEGHNLELRLSSNKCHASSNRCLTSSNKKLVVTRLGGGNDIWKL